MNPGFGIEKVTIIVVFI